MVFLMKFEFVLEFAPENALKSNKTTKSGNIPNIYLLTKIAI